MEFIPDDMPEPLREILNDLVGIHRGHSEMSCALCGETLAIVPILQRGNDEDNALPLGLTILGLQGLCVTWVEHVVEKHTTGFNEEGKRLMARRMSKLLGETPPFGN